MREIIDAVKQAIPYASSRFYTQFAQRGRANGPFVGFNPILAQPSFYAQFE